MQNNKHNAPRAKHCSLPEQTQLHRLALCLWFWPPLCFLSPKELEIAPRADNFGAVPGKGWHGDDSAHPGERGLRHSGPLSQVLPCESGTAAVSVLRDWVLISRQPEDPPALELARAQWIQIPEPSWCWFSSVRISEMFSPAGLNDGNLQSGLEHPSPLGNHLKACGLCNMHPVWRAPHRRQDVQVWRIIPGCLLWRPQ